MDEIDTTEQLRRLVTVEDYGERWLSPENWRQTLQRSTVLNYRCAFRCYIEPLIGGVRLMDLHPWHVCHLLVRLEDKGYFPSTGRRVVLVLSSMLWQAKRDRLVCRNVAAQVEPPGRTWLPYLTVNGYESIDRTKAGRP